MEITFVAKVAMTVDHHPGNKTTAVRTVDFMLCLDPKLEQSVYIGEDGLPNKEGCKLITQCFVNGLIGNIHAAKQGGYRDDAEHLRDIISQLEKGFVATHDIKVGEFPKL